ncbi:MAG: hypothetical protein CVU97_04235 [Firmicutes bacterium HGW-Firmicutes-21]|nr:MAG: hypothetical protein CVU97_04235 [Firmicutes bacterium HGW-Firmicutes-21]
MEQIGFASWTFYTVVFMRYLFGSETITRTFEEAMIFVWISEYVLNEYRKQFGAVFQDYEIIATTLAENITMSTDRIDEEKPCRCSGR